MHLSMCMMVSNTDASLQLPLENVLWLCEIGIQLDLTAICLVEVSFQSNENRTPWQLNHHNNFYAVGEIVLFSHLGTKPIKLQLTAINPQQLLIDYYLKC